MSKEITVRKTRNGNNRIKSLEKTTEFIHMVFGLIAIFIVEAMYPEADKSDLLFAGILGTFLPDLDHFLFLYVYGRKHDYTQMYKEVIEKFNIWAGVKFLLKNHKQLTGVITHNLITFIIVFAFALYQLFNKENPVWGVFFLSWALHYIWDIVEDLIYYGGLNKNWTLKFNRDKFKFF